MASPDDLLVHFVHSVHHVRGPLHLVSLTGSLSNQIFIEKNDFSV